MYFLVNKEGTTCLIFTYMDVLKKTNPKSSGLLGAYSSPDYFKSHLRYDDEALKRFYDKEQD